MKGLKAEKDDIEHTDGLSSLTIERGMLSSVKGSHKAYIEHIKIQKKKKELKTRKEDITSEL